MGLSNHSSFWDVGLVLFMLVAGVWLYFKSRYTYWQKRNLPYLKPCFPFGTMENPFSRTTSFGYWIKTNYDELKARGLNHGGIYSFADPIYLPIAPEYIKHVMQTDFQYFVDRGLYYNEKDDPLSAHLSAIGGEKWKNLRTKLTPSLTGKKIKTMFKIFLECSKPMEDLIRKLSKTQQKLDIKEIMGRFTTDVIGSTAYGLDCNSFTNPDSDFRKYGKRIFAPTKYETMKGLMVLARPKLGHWLKIRALPKDATDFFGNIVKDTVKYREANQVVRNDMLQILIDLKNASQDDGTNLTIDEIKAQAFVFFTASFETSSTTMAYCLYELASNKDIQDKVRKEIKDVLEKHGGKISYESLKDMYYMNQVIWETLRKYPAVPYITRTCVKNYHVPGTDVLIEKGTKLIIPIIGLHHDPEFFPEPEKFDPKRFNKKNCESRRPFTYIPFGEGPRICIGMRFGWMQVKLALVVLLKEFEFSVNSNTMVPLEIDPYKFFHSTKGTIWLDSKIVE